MSGEKRAPELPEVVDEAGDSAPWVGWAGLALFGLIALVFIVKMFGGEPAHPVAGEGTAAAAAADSPEKP